MLKIIALATLVMTGCGAVESAERELESSTPTPTPTPSVTVLPTTDSHTEVDVYVTVADQQQTEQNASGTNDCTGPVHMYLVLDRETSSYPWRVAAESQDQADANDFAHSLIVQGYFQDNVSVVEQRDNSCVDGLTGEISPY